jgi:hypothetical protein
VSTRPVGLSPRSFRSELDLYHAGWLNQGTSSYFTLPGDSIPFRLFPMLSQDMSVDRFNSFSSAGKPFYADGFSVLEVVGQYDSFFKLGLTEADKRDLIEDLFGLPAPGSKDIASRAVTEELITPDGWS